MSIQPVDSSENKHVIQPIACEYREVIRRTSVSYAVGHRRDVVTVVCRPSSSSCQRSVYRRKTVNATYGGGAGHRQRTHVVESTEELTSLCVLPSYRATNCVCAPSMVTKDTKHRSPNINSQLIHLRRIPSFQLITPLIEITLSKSTDEL